MDGELVGAVAKAMATLFNQTTRFHPGPMNAQLIWKWGEVSDDPDACRLATWIQQGAPLAEFSLG